MTEKLKKAYLAYQRSSEPDFRTYFFRTDAQTGKKSKVSFIANANIAPVLSLSQHDPVVLSALTDNLQQIMNVVHLPPVQVGNRVVMQASGQQPATGVQFQLSASDWYFAMNGGPILCNGQQLGYNFRGRFIQRFPARCAPGTPTQYYDELKLF